MREIVIPENEAILTKTQNWFRDRTTGQHKAAHRAAWHVCSTANITDMSEAAETWQMALGAQEWRVFSFFGKIKQGLGASYASATAGEIYSGWKWHSYCSWAMHRSKTGLMWLPKTPSRQGLQQGWPERLHCRCHSCPSTSKCNLLQNSNTFLAQEDTGLSLTHLRNWTGAQHPFTAITLVYALLTLLVSSVFCLGYHYFPENSHSSVQ